MSQRGGDAAVTIGTRLQYYFRELPNSTASDAIAALNLDISAAYSALSNLCERGALVLTSGDARPRRYAVAPPVVPAELPVFARRNAPFEYHTLTRPTGTLVEHAGQLQVIQVLGANVAERGRNTFSEADPRTAAETRRGDAPAGAVWHPWQKLRIA